MDVAYGVELHSIWHTLTMKQKLQLDFPAKDVHDVSVDGQTNEGFVLGPDTLQVGFLGGLLWSKILELDRGSCRRKFFEEKIFAQEEEDDMTWTEMEDAREEITRAVGVNSDGWVPNKDYERVVGVNEMAHMA
ncbi:hypothetical protein BDN70DRAFT_926341 [Pholiota conissans]|uniref:Uncharacterized protein n=1 Tax=Pholiota conissans TaxID=109636 RepID=A0A9P5YKZ7_9AGAR|nr:hypothetical protein BDN70DRAFT_926341 [Pholiota conissans]